MQIEERPRQTLRQDVQDEQDGLRLKEQSPNGGALFLMPTVFHPVNLFILSDFIALTAWFPLMGR